MHSKYEIFWEVTCDHHGWDYEDGSEEHWDELTAYEKDRLIQIWHEEGLE